jgi:hypothetical protein
MSTTLPLNVVATVRWQTLSLRRDSERHRKKPKLVEGYAPTRSGIILVRYDSEMRHFLVL